jgi:septal ring factor EnvC (AmiA/AmiB activator)
MRGFGLLLIIDHGDGYMSLYGHNESVLVEEGDWVESGQPVATMGMSGGGSRPGLYFEIRYKGKPQDPMRWCRR